MFLVDLLQFVFDVQATTCDEAGAICPGTAFHAISAAYATQGYWVQADLLDMLTFSKFNAVAPLIYVIAAIGGLVAVALGQPPKTYMWFFLGPALFAWLIDTRQEVTGVQWQVADQKQDQRQVWKLAEVGLLNTNLAKRMELWGGGHGISASEPPNDVWVSNFFVWYDSVLSSAINAMIGWAGPYTWQSNDTAPDDTNAGNVQNLTATDMQNDKWFLMTNLKWGFIEDITSAKLSSHELHDVFAEFMGGACGTAMGKAINTAAYAAAVHARGDNIPYSVFNRRTNFSPDSPDNDMTDLIQKLQEAPVVPFPPKLKTFMADVGINLEQADRSFRGSLGGSLSADAESLFTSQPDGIACDTYLLSVILAFRWEAGHIFSQLVYKVPDLSPDQDSDDPKENAGENAKKLVHNLFYGWDIKKHLSGGTSQPLIEQEAQYFLTDLILLHIFRNEFMLLQPVDVQSNGSWTSRSYVEEQQRQIGSKSKWGEIYSWAILMPHLQGVLLYYLAMGYPFACLLMLIPGWHKALFTWMSFWAWVKMWDLGFALVMALERSVWATIGNSSASAGLHSRIIDMQSWGCVASNITCDSNSGAEVPIVKVATVAGGGVGGLFGGGSVCGYNMCPAGNDPYNLEGMIANFKIFDRALTLGPSLDLDLSNAYYIYIMAALYLAVPAVTGQLVLGAKSGAAGLIGTAIGGVAQEGGRAAGSGHSAAMERRASSNTAIAGQAAAAEGYAGMAAQALKYGNQERLEGMGGQLADAKSRGAGYMQQTADLGARTGSAFSSILRGPLQSAFNNGDMWSSTGQSFKTLTTGASMGPSQAGPGMMDNPWLRRGVGTGIDLGAGQASNIFGGKWASKAGASLMAVEGAMQVAALNQANATNATQAGYGVASFDKSSASSGYGKAAQYANEGAQFASDSNRFNKMNAFANRMAGSMGAIGVSSNAYNPGPAPMGMIGMARDGRLGGEAKAESGYFDQGTGGFWGERSSAVGQLNSQYGAGAVSNARFTGSMGDFFNSADSHYRANGGGLGPLGYNTLGGVYANQDFKDVTNPSWMSTTQAIQGQYGVGVEQAMNSFGVPGANVKIKE